MEVRIIDRAAATAFVTRMNNNDLLQLSKDRVPPVLGKRLKELGVVYDVYGDGVRFALSQFGVVAVNDVIRRRKLDQKRGVAKAIVVTDDERREREVRRIQTYQRRLEAREAEARRLVAIEEGNKLARLLTRGLTETECVSCGCDIEFKELRIFDRTKKYECTVCGEKLRPKRIPRETGNGGRLPVIAISGGLGAIVCWDCVEFCSSCWTDGTYKHIMKVYGVDLRD